MIKNIIFDIGNVLAPFNWQKVFSSLFDEKTSEIIANATVKNKLWDELDLGARDYNELVSEFVKICPEQEDNIHLMLKHLHKSVVPFDYSESLVKELKDKGYKVYVLSNYGDIPFNEARKNFTFFKYLDGAVISYQEKIIKPDVKIYRIICDRYNLIPEETIFFDDKIENILSAKSIGINAIHFKNLQQAKSEMDCLIK